MIQHLFSRYAKRNTAERIKPRRVRDSILTSLIKKLEIGLSKERNLYREVKRELSPR